MNEQDKIKFETNITEISGTRYLRVPPQLADHLEFVKDAKIIAIADKGKHGKFLACWLKENNTTDSDIKDSDKHDEK